ncbi:MAG TPA: hypothetical protein ENL06_03470 [Candidatus Portnoybacteria bacterium]|nr:hypothetical protein [Candidatus Portnoybacteria bacterium]
MFLSILSISQKLFEGEVKSVSVPSIDGRLQILDHHIPLITPLKDGEVRFELSEGEIGKIPIDKGVVEVRPNDKEKIIILANF